MPDLYDVLWVRFAEGFTGRAHRSAVVARENVVEGSFGFLTFQLTVSLSLP
jgi:hypothetical protein